MFVSTPQTRSHQQHVIAQIRRIPIPNLKIAAVGVKLHEGEGCGSERRPHVRGGGQGGAGVEALRLRECWMSMEGKACEGNEAHIGEVR